MKKVGLTIGKFAPFHEGHEYLIKTAIEEMDEVYAIIYETDVIDIPLEERGKWIKNQYPNVNLIYAYNPPEKYGMDEESVKIQTKYIEERVKDLPITHFYSCEPYGQCVAEELNIQDRRLEKIKQEIPLSATTIRSDIEKYKEYINDDVYKVISNRKKNENII